MGGTFFIFEGTKNVLTKCLSRSINSIEKIVVFERKSTSESFRILADGVEQRIISATIVG